MSLPEIDSETVIARTQKWVEKTVIGLNLCPFAKAAQSKNQIRYTVSSAQDTDALLLDLISELRYVSKIEADVTDTSILIHPGVLTDFMDYNDFLDVTEAALIEMKLEGILQIASFHPDYQFEGTEIQDPENYTNRSPYPMLHILREASVAKAIDSYGDVSKIPERNIELLRNMDAAAFKKLKDLL